MTKALVPHLASQHPSATLLLDPSQLGELPVLPLVPEPILRKHHVYVASDNRFRAAARLLQALWRSDRDLPCGFVVDGEGRRQKLGSRIPIATGDTGANFMDQATWNVVRRCQVYSEIGALLEPFRLRSNLLSSTALAFNVFGPISRNLALASRFMETLVPSLMSEVVEVRFEHSPGRGRALFTNDFSAFDVVFRGRTPDGKRALFAIEVKFTESMSEPSPQDFSRRHEELVRSSGNFIDPEDPSIFAPPHQQLTRLLNLAQAAVDAEIYDVAYLALVSPHHNHLTQSAAESFANLLTQPGPRRIGFLNIELEHVWVVLAEIGQYERAVRLHRRYSDFWRLDGELGLPDINDVDASLAAPQA